MANRGKPCLGFPTRLAAIEALQSEGLTPGEIAAQTGLSVNHVSAAICTARKRAEGRADHRAAAKKGWTPAKHRKAIRLYAAIVELVARALKVPPAELLALWSKGTTPPMGRARLNEIDGVAAETGSAVELLLPPPRPVPCAQEAVGTFDWDEAPTRPASPATLPARGREKMAVGEVTLPTTSRLLEDFAAAKPGARFHLRLAGGDYLNIDGSGTIRGSIYAWIGSHDAAKAMQAKSELAARMSLVPAEVWQPRDVAFEREMRR